MQLPGGKPVGVLGQDVVQKLSHHLHHLTGWGQRAQEGLLHLSQALVQHSEVLLCGGKQTGDAPSASGAGITGTSVTSPLHPAARSDKA